MTVNLRVWIMTTDAYDIGPQSTEWDDALRKHGIIPKVKKAPTNDAIDTKIMWEEKEKDPFADKTLQDLDELEDEIEEDVCFPFLSMTDLP